MTATLNGHVLSVKAATDRKGPAGSVTVSVDDGSGAVQAQVPITIVTSTRPLTQVSEAVVEAAGAGVTEAIDITQYTINPFPSTPLRITATSVQVGRGTADPQGTTLNITPATGFHGQMTVVYRVMDATGDADRVVEGTVSRGQTVAWCRRNGTVQDVRLSELLMTEALDRVSVEQAGPGDIIAIAGIPEITIGETISDPDDPRPLPLIHVDEPSLSMTIGINTSPLSGRSGTQLTARLVKNRLDAELVGNVSIRVLGTDRPDTWEVQGRGELQLAVLVEMMRREGFELTVGKPEVVTRRDGDGTLLEPTDRLTVDVPEEFLGTVTEMMGTRKGTMDQMINHGSGWVRMEYVVPSRGLIGFRTEFLTSTRGTGIMNHVWEGWTPWAGEMRNRPTGSLVADRQGVVSSYALFNLQERGELFVGPGDEVYEGMVVGENSRPDEMDVNPTKEKHLTNVRSSTGDELERLIPPRRMSLEQSLEFCAADECLEVTPDAVRVRKVVLDARDRAKLRIRNRNQDANA